MQVLFLAKDTNHSQDEIQAESDRTHWKEHLKNLGSESGNYGDRYGKRGGRYNERRIKNGNIYKNVIDYF